MAAIMTINKNEVLTLPVKVLKFRRILDLAVRDPDQVTYPGFNDVQSAMEMMLKYYDQAFNITTTKTEHEFQDGLVVKDID